jgi:DNA methyltransferase 1-associated protein 1
MFSEYPFAKYNVQPTSYTYSEDEYARFLEGLPRNASRAIFLHSTDKEWNKEETDYLFRLAGEYDLRWYIIQDRYDRPDGTPRTVEARMQFLFDLYVLTHCRI